MSYFFYTSKPHLLSHQTENISLAVIISLTHFISTGKKQYSLEMFINLNKNTLYVNFNEHHKREFIVILIIPIGVIKTKQKSICI